MKSPLPIHHLKRRAKLLRRKEEVPLHAALDRVAMEEGYRSWSLLMARQPEAMTASMVFARLAPGDLMIVAGRPGQGKTLLSLAFAVEAMKRGNRCVLFSLEYTEPQLAERLGAIGAGQGAFAGLFALDCSDAISADYIVGRLTGAARGTLVVIDYLQLLDQRRDKPELALQMRVLKVFARERGLILVFISQVDRSYEGSGKPFPDMTDVRLPNPLDLTLFDKACFVSKGELRFQSAA